MSKNSGDLNSTNLEATTGDVSPDASAEEDDAPGEWFRQLFEEHCYFEQEDRMLSRAVRVARQLQEGRPESELKVVEIPWLEEFTAFTLTGRYIYIARRLYQICSNDEEVAFIVAHEMAHHDLGHLDAFDGWISGVKLLPGGKLFGAVLKGLANRVYSVEQECDADLYALELCAKSGYRPESCVRLFDLLEEHVLNMGGLDAVYGLDEENDYELSDDAPLSVKLKIWAWHRWNGYLPIRDRRQALLDHLEKSELPRVRGI
jgi:Zn-dependent protease with chaperone function